jgi:hypothetical protein
MRAQPVSLCFFAENPLRKGLDGTAGDPSHHRHDGEGIDAAG